MRCACRSTPPRGHPLTFHAWARSERLHPGRFGHAGHRMGRWCGRMCCWCRCWRSTGGATGWATAAAITTARSPALPDARTIGCAFAAQELPDGAGRADRHPAGLQIATERGLIPRVLRGPDDAHPVSRRHGWTQSGREAAAAALVTGLRAALRHRPGGGECGERQPRIRPGARHGADAVRGGRGRDHARATMPGTARRSSRTSRSSRGCCVR